MKTSKYFKTIAICAVMLAAALPGKAQLFPKTYINIDWQVGVPLGADFADKTSGWGRSSPTRPICKAFRVRRSTWAAARR